MVGIITIPNVFAETSAMLNKTMVEIGIGQSEQVKVHGIISNVDTSTIVHITYTYPDGTTDPVQVFSTESGIYNTILNLDDKSPKGVYKILVTSQGQIIDILELTVSEKKMESHPFVEITTTKSEPILETPPSSKPLGIAPFVDQTKDPQHYIDRYHNELTYKNWFNENYPQYSSIYEAVGMSEQFRKIPSWINDTMQWYLDGIISEDELISAITFLVRENIISIYGSENEQLENKVKILENTIQSLENKIKTLENKIKTVNDEYSETNTNSLLGIFEDNILIVDETQRHGPIVINIQKIEYYEGYSKIFLSIENTGGEDAHIYENKSSVIQGKTQFQTMYKPLSATGKMIEGYDIPSNIIREGVLFIEPWNKNESFEIRMEGMYWTGGSIWTSTWMDISFVFNIDPE